jgi:hypothetical protein
VLLTRRAQSASIEELSGISVFYKDPNGAIFREHHDKYEAGGFVDA